MTTEIARRPLLVTLALLVLLGLPAVLRADDAADFNRLLAQCRKEQSEGKYREAERTALKLRRLAEGSLREEPMAMALAVGEQADVYQSQGRYAEAEPLYKRALAIREKKLGPEHPDVAASLNNLANLYNDQGRYAEAEPLYKRALAIREKKLGPEHPDVAASLNNLAILYNNQGRYAEAEPLYKRALTICEKKLGPEHPDVAAILNGLAILYLSQGRYAETEPLYKRALAIREKKLGPEHPDVAASLNNLANLYNDQGRYAEAEPLYKRALAIREKKLGPEHPNVAGSLNNLAILYDSQGRYAEAEPLYKRSLAIREKKLRPEHPDVATSLNNLAILYLSQGRYAEAEPLYKRALAIWEKKLGPEHPHVATSLNNLAALYAAQGRYAEAEPLYKRALAIQEKKLGPEHPDVATSLNNLAGLYYSQGRYAEAEPLYKRALAIREKKLGPEHPKVATSLNNLAVLYNDQGRYAEAEPLYKRSLAIREKKLGPEHPDVAGSLHNLALLYDNQGRYDKAKRFVDQAISIYDRTKAEPEQRMWTYNLRAQLAWRAERRDEALADLRQAMSLAEQQRAHASGAEQQRAQLFAQFGGVFERMVAWQTELGGVGEALDAMERSRARSLLDQMETHGMDLLADVPQAEARRLRRHERDATARIAELEKQLELLDNRSDLSLEQRKAQGNKLYAQMREARRDYAEAYADIRNASPAYRLAIGQDRKPVALKKLTRWVAGQEALLLEYFLGVKGGYVLIVPTQGEPRLEPLVVGKAQARVLGIEPGPLTAEKFKIALSGSTSDSRETGLLKYLRDAEHPDKIKEAFLGLAALWELLIPEAERGTITDGAFKRLIILPDGPLAKLPFEVLVVEPGDDPKYLLDVGPPIEYGPSATILVNLAERRAAQTVREPVLTVGNPEYRTPTRPDTDSMLAQLTARSRYGALRGRLDPLPGSGKESGWVVQVFKESGVRSIRLDGRKATEANVRRKIPGRRIVHLACHGLADQKYGNLFGALAFAPGADSDDSADDGFLTLAEIYGLNLKSCELAILSACDTNFGPQQRGEGVWAISRGFLVAGSKRVVASNWLVDDEAAATLISFFCGGIADAEKEGTAVDHAKALRQAKRWIRNNPDHPKWKHPYYWAPFVLMGPR